ncbi:MAG: sulfotransferase, partial [Alphaproteobacteria bacterium]|nr:sulfotransferase [Alphaproteobacteria bacterium]
ADARAQTGLDDFGDPTMFDGLNRLIDALNTEAKISETGAQRWSASITATLANRLKVEDYLKANPHLLDAPIEKPLFVFGLPRTGTTLAINLLTADPARRFFMRWEAMNTIPPAGPGAQRTDPRYHEEQARLDMALKYLPHITAMHHEDADSSTECQFAMAPAFCAQLYDSQAYIPSYSEWFLHTDYRPAFRYHKRLMQLLQQHNKGRWTFKNPWHPLYLDALHETYPDAQLVMTHRDPAEVVASACSLIFAVRQMFGDNVDPVACSDLLVHTFDLMIARVDAFEAKQGARSIHHILYTDLVTDPVGEMRKVYAKFGEPFRADAESAMQALMAAKPQNKFGKHEYKLEDYGLTRNQVHDHFADYIDRYGIVCKGRG